jgi:hypothetical protein
MMEDFFYIVHFLIDLNTASVSSFTEQSVVEDLPGRGFVCMPGTATGRIIA